MYRSHLSSTMSNKAQITHMTSNRILVQNVTGTNVTTKKDNSSTSSEATMAKVNEFCSHVDYLTSLNCTCGTRSEYPEMVVVDCKGANDSQQVLVYDHGELLLEKTCGEFTHEEDTSVQDLVCVTEYYYGGQGNKPVMCEAEINGDKCDFCSPQGGVVRTSCEDGIYLRCQGYDTGSLCTNADGSKHLQLVKFSYTTSNQANGIDPTGLVLAFCFVVAVAFVKILARSTQSSTSPDYGTLEMSRATVRQGGEDPTSDTNAIV